MRTIFREIVGLFVDDGAFALAILVWIAAVGILAHSFPALASGILLFVGLAAGLLVSTIQLARRRTR